MKSSKAKLAGDVLKSYARSTKPRESSPKPNSLSEDELLSLRMLGDGIGRPDPNTDALLRMRLVSVHHGRFGVYTVATATGLAALCADKSAPHPKPAANALRVTYSPQLITYYPVGTNMQAIKHGEKVYVQTKNKCFRSYKQADTSDDVTSVEPPA